MPGKRVPQMEKTCCADAIELRPLCSRRCPMLEVRWEDVTTTCASTTVADGALLRSGGVAVTDPNVPGQE